MKINKILSLFFIIILFLSSCTFAGSGKEKTVSSIKNKCGLLLKKIPSDFDEKFGYKALVYEIKGDSSKLIETNKVFISKETWERLPEPNDSISINIEYIENIEYGKGVYLGFLSLWDYQLNICTGFTIDKLKEKS